MSRGSHLIIEIDRLAEEVGIVYQSIVLPGWNGPNHGMPDTLYGYMMGIFSRIDLISAHWKGSFRPQTERMVSFMTTFMHTDRTANSLAVQMWRHKLMHTSAPRELKDPKSGGMYRWLLHWGDDHLPREQHFNFQPNGLNLNLSLMELIDNTRQAAADYIKQMHASPSLATNYDAVAHELANYEFRNV